MAFRDARRGRALAAFLLAELLEFVVCHERQDCFGCVSLDLRWFARRLSSIVGRDCLWTCCLLGAGTRDLLTHFKLIDDCECSDLLSISADALAGHLRRLHSLAQRAFAFLGARIVHSSRQARAERTAWTTGTSQVGALEISSRASMSRVDQIASPPATIRHIKDRSEVLKRFVAASQVTS